MSAAIPCAELFDTGRVHRILQNRNVSFTKM